MKLLRVAFRCFGPFEDQTLDFSGPDGLHVIFGPNEAGKSSALRGLHALLFRFPAQSADNFRFKYAQFRIRALLERSDGTTLECVRRKGIKATLRDGDDKTEVAESVLAQFLGDLEQHQFEQLFGLDSQRLIEGGQEIADGHGDLGEALFAAGAGLAGLRALAQSLEQAQDALYKERGQSQPINKALKERMELLTEVRTNALAPEKYALAALEAREAHDRAESLRGERSSVRSRLGLLERLQAALPAIELLQRAQERLDSVASAPRLAADFHDRLDKARQKREAALSKLKLLDVNREQLERLLRDEQPPAVVLAEEAEIDELKKLVGADAKQQGESMKAEARRSEEEGKARDIYRQLTGSTDWEGMSGLKPRLDHEQRIAELGNEHKAVLEDVAKCERAVRLAREALAIAEAKRANAPAATDAAPLRALVESITALGPLEDQARARNREASGAEATLAAEFARLQPPVPGRWTEAALLPIPSLETVTQFRNELDKARQKISDAVNDRDAIDRDIAAARSQRVSAEGAEAVPTPDDLTNARNARDGGLSLIGRRLADQPDAVAETAFMARHAPNRSLIAAVETSVRGCDVLADRLRHEADRIALWQRMNRQIELLEGRRQEATGKLAELEAALAAVDEAWQAIWSSSAIAPGTPEAMFSWRTSWDRLIQGITAWNELRLRCAADERQIVELRARLADTFPPSQETQTLAEGLALARQALALALANQTAAERLIEELARLQPELEAAEKDLARARDRQDRWVEKWSESIRPLGLGEPSTSVETASDYMRRIIEMQQHLTQMRIKAAAVREIAEERASLLVRLTALRQRLDPAARPSTGESLNLNYRELEVALMAARALRTQHEERTTQLKKVAADQAATGDDLRVAEAALAALAAEAGVATSDEIAEAVRRASERVMVEGQVRDQEKVLAQSARGQPLEEFIADAMARSADLEGEIEALNRRAAALDPDIAEAEKRAHESDQVVNAFRQASDAAAEARQQAELVTGTLEERVIEYAALQLASAVLDRAKARYRARHQDSLLDRAGGFFRTLTDGAFSGLDIDNEEGRDVLKAVRAANHPNSRVAVDGLSDGTRDQLFLALRLAGIEQHLVEREPVPLIIDDVLVSSDDARTRATLKCLAELAARTQVLLFTHHRHVVDSARAVNPRTAVHELGRPGTGLE
jgi:uncharacterized protein YhaN